MSEGKAGGAFREAVAEALEFAAMADGEYDLDRITTDLLAAARRQPGIWVSPQDCERLAAMLNVHVRPVYYKAANRKDRKGQNHSAERALAAPMLTDCDRLADAFTAASEEER